MNLYNVAKELKLHLKIVVSVQNFENYNAFFNIYSELEEPCRRVLILTNDEKIEEVMEVLENKPFEFGTTVDDNIWLYSYPLTFNPTKLNLKELEVTEEEVKIIRERVEKNEI